MVHNTLTIAGSDSGGGAGIQADLKTFTALGVYGASVITAVTAQNTVAVTNVHVLPVDVVRAQLEAVLDDIRIDAIKIGMLPTAEIIDVVSAALPDVPVVLDPVLIATSGARLVDDDALAAMRRLTARATVITPNLFEVGALLGSSPPADVAAMEAAAPTLGARAALVKGGHLEGSSSVDVLWDGAALHRIEAPRIASDDTHGSGCTLSSAIAAYLAGGASLLESVVAAKRFVSDAIAYASVLDVGRGAGPLNHLYTP